VTRRLQLIVVAALCVAALWYLRDPGWLSAQTSGLSRWERAPDGTRYRWSGGHASFFVPSDASQIRIPIATTFDPPNAAPMTVTVTVDDTPAGRIVLTDARWQTVPFRLPRPGSRSVRRIDVRTNITRADNHGVMIGEIELLRAGPK
jgi:hypothetical protein